MTPLFLSGVILLPFKTPFLRARYFETISTIENLLLRCYDERPFRLYPLVRVPMPEPQPIINAADRKPNRIPFFYGMLIVGLFLFLELSAWLAYGILFKQVFSFQTLSNERKAIFTVDSTTAKTGERVQDNNAPSFTYMIHPYYGYISNPVWVEQVHQREKARDGGEYTIMDDLNHFGFFGEEESVQPADKSKLIVAVGGGSLAAFAGAWGKSAFKEELKKIPAFKDKQIVVINLGQPGYKQPQLLLVVNDLLAQGGHIDLLINLDGFNEIALPMAHRSLNQGQSIFFPQCWRMTAETQWTKEQLFAVARWNSYIDSRQKAARFFSRFPLSWSVTANLYWKIQDAYKYKQQIICERQLTERKNVGEITSTGQVRATSDNHSFLGPWKNYSNYRELYLDITRHWIRCSILLNNTIEGQGGVYFHFLQPNQYFAGSKPMLAEEKFAAFNPDSPYRQEVERGYPYLRAAGEYLSNLGFPFSDLTYLFKEVETPLYMDNCCHLNREGVDRMARFMVKVIADTLTDNGNRKGQYFDLQDTMPDDRLFERSSLKLHSADPEHYQDGTDISIQADASPF